MTNSLLIKLISNLYLIVIRPILFKIDPEDIHNFTANLSYYLSKEKAAKVVISNIFNYKNNILNQRILDIKFSNPIGLAAGFDYEGKTSALMSDFGFGFNTIGTVTAKPYDGNTKPRLKRLIESKSILVNKGFKSTGIDNVLKRLDNLNLDNTTLGISIGSSNISEIDTIPKAINDYIYSLDKIKNKEYLKYIEINISCPNTRLKETFADLKNLEILISEVQNLNIKKPIFIKMANEVELQLLESQIKLALKYKINGFILSNLLKERSNKYFTDDELNSIKGLNGNFSGKPTFINSNNRINHAKKMFGNDIVLIACGGIFNADDAYKQIKSGASLVQLITGMIYNGPQLISEINQGLVKLLKKDGFSNIKEAIGVDN